ncbi:EAL domain-containing protein [Rhodococcus sp. IEGM 1381]|uniref:putative bifunctional diguanylate cyclase/phosphodiesterase n=1 Tax=Rhodococcus sp. IEGM 1381 TaxID=3047085 RepID=UPI0024B64F06|nr:EAL domain-containing protein [Rhodococcus sp. IEGM 1381]MDI9894123.1 EAL domain-containing protein [Rhodococcus sp. IEGM 1381]
MGVDAATVREAYESVLRRLVDHLGIDFSFLRHNDFEARATVLSAEWPPRLSKPDPDPLAVVKFDDADSVFALAETLTEPAVFRPGQQQEGYRRRVEQGSGFSATSMAVVPLLHAERTIGILGLIKIGDRSWSEVELNALKAIAALLSQLQARVIAEEQLRFAALHDQLTSLPNRTALAQHLRERLDPSMPGPVAVMHIDLDRLKALNDFLGHLAGDHFLETIADRLHSFVGDSAGIVARLGGDEFVVVLAGPCSARVATHHAEVIADAIGAPVTLGVERISRTASIGIAFGQPGRHTAESLLRQADRAALVAKRAGGHDIALFTDEMHADSELRNDVEIHLRDAIAGDSLILHFQPEVDLVSGRITAVEALVRWQHPTRGLLPPSAFIPVAEETNLAGELGRWVLEHACRTLADWQRDIPELDISMRVNISPVQLVTNGFVGAVARALEEFSIAGPNLCLEITEVAVVQDLSRTRVTLRELRELGVQVAIDDFGTGYSSLSHLKELPVDALKIDRAFVTELGNGTTGDLAIVQSIIGLADAFGLSIIAEGVETQSARNTLIELGCIRAQGYLFSKPIAAEDALILLHGERIDV